MATAQRQKRVPQPPAPMGFFARWQKRLFNNVRQAITRGDLVTMIIVWALLMMPVFALNATNEVEGVWTLGVIVILSSALGYLLAWSSLSEGFALIVSSSYGFAVICVLEVLAIGNGGSISDRVVDFLKRINDSFQTASNGIDNQDSILLVVFLAILAWILGHNTVWHIFRIDRVWRAIVPPGFALLVNNARYHGDKPLDVLLVMYVLLSLLLIVRSHVDAREYEWYRNRVRYPRYMRKYFLRVGAALAIIFVLIAWIIPTGEEKPEDDRLDNFLESLSNLSDTLDRLFSPLESPGLASPEYYGGDQLELGGPIQLGDGPVLEVEAPQTGTRYYWRSTVFDTYIGGLWEHNRAVRATKEDDGLQLNIGDYAGRQVITQQIKVLMTATSLVYAAPEPREFGLPVRVELDCINDPTSTECVNNNLPTDLSISRTVKPLREGDTYTIQSSISTASANELRTASADYPTWVTNRYLQGTEQVTQRLRDLTVQIINSAGATTPYDKAKAIERWLRVNITYDEAIPSPPAGRDPVDWVVFEHQRGYCNYYASAMIMMLRSQGIPARMAAGFSQGEYDAADGLFHVAEDDAHTWVEVYFPGFGWVNFEPTADEASLDREGDDLTQDQSQPTATPLPSPTPTIAPTSTPLPPENGEPPSPTPLQNEQLIPPTATPTFTPVPQSSPTPTPPQETEITDDGNGDITKLIIKIVLGVFIALVLAVIGVLFLIWWVEHRGLGGLSLTEKAYARMAIYGKWLGIQLPSQNTPEERRKRLVTDVPEGESPISDITSLYVESHFAPPRETRDAEAGKAWSEARMAFIKRKLRNWFSWGR